MALGIASSINSHNELFEVHLPLSHLHLKEGKLSDAHAHIEHAESHSNDDPFRLAHASMANGLVWSRRDKFEEATSEAQRAFDVFRKLGAEDYAEEVREFIRRIDRCSRE